jgi:hypothetical protein
MTPTHCCYDVTVYPQADGFAGNTSRDGHVLLMCDVTDPTPTAGHTETTAYSIAAGAYHVYIAVAWKRVDQIRHNISSTFSI